MKHNWLSLSRHVTTCIRDCIARLCAWSLTYSSFQFGLIAWLLSTGVGLLLAFLRFDLSSSSPYTPCSTFFLVRCERKDGSRATHYGRSCMLNVPVGGVPLFLWVASNFDRLLSLCANALMFLHSQTLTVLFVRNSKSSIILGLAVTVPMLVAAVAVGVPIWVENGYSFYPTTPLEFNATRAYEEQARRGRTKEVRYSYLQFWGFAVKIAPKLSLFTCLQ